MKRTLPTSKIISIVGGGNYFASPKTDIQFIPSGCQVLDLALGGGWAEDRIANIIGDRSTGKTLLCIEASANFARKYPKGKIRYRESEAAFDPQYAEALGMPLDRVDFGDKPLETVEDLFEDLTLCVQAAKGPELYIVDSLDALSSRAERARPIDEGTYGGDKAKKMSELFRRLASKLAGKHVTVIIVSQVRDKIGVTFGRRWTRTGGRALDFYASQAVYLAQAGLVQKEISKIRRTVGVDVRAKIDKNKVGLPYREAQFEILFGFGIADIRASLDWLKQVGHLGDVGVSEAKVRAHERTMIEANDPKAFAELNAAVQARWHQIESRFLPTRRKYE